MIDWIKSRRDDADRQSPYVDWWQREAARPGGGLRSGTDLLDIAGCVPAPGPDASPAFGQGDASGSTRLPVPAGTANPSPPDTPMWSVEDLRTRVGHVPRDTTIVGIIDDAIPFAHPRFRLPDPDGAMSTRFLAGWLQGAEYQSGPIPFGREYLQHDIQDLMRGAGRASRDWLDEDAFYAALTGPDPRLGGLSEAALNMRVAAGHGAAVLDVACGAEPDRARAAELARERIIAVGLPPRRTIGMAGTYLEFFVINAMQRIIDLADAIWNAQYPGETGGFPVVIVLSYGQQSGTKSGDSLLEQHWTTLEAGRTQAPTRLVMPVGNENLLRCNARQQLMTERPMSIPWRIMPEDQTANFIEVWADLHDGEMTAEDDPFPIGMALSPPGTAPVGQAGWIAAQDGHVFDHPDGSVRIYTDIVPMGDGPEGPRRRLRFVIAMRATLEHSRPDASGRAGCWSLDLSLADGAESRIVSVNVQIDQDPRSQSRVSQRSFLDSAGYRVHDPSGRAVDTYGYLAHERLFDHNGTDLGHDLERDDMFGVVQRKGTQNALANRSGIFAVAGYRASDGRPSAFSATFTPKGERPAGDVMVEPQVAFPADEAPATLGLRAAAPRAGGTQVIRGTSLAAPQAARWIVDELRKARNDAADPWSVTTPEALAEAGREAERTGASSAYPADAHALKVGAGRMPSRTGRHLRVYR